MSVLDLLLSPNRTGLVIIGCAALVLAVGGCAWQVQAWRYGQQLEHQARLQADTLNELALAGASLQRKEQDKRFALEQRLNSSDQTHHSELTHAQQQQKTLLDRLATSELRLSVLLAATDSGGDSVSATAGTGGVVHGTRRAQLDPAHAQRIVGITGDGDRGLIALKACQDYAKDVSTPR